MHLMCAALVQTLHILHACTVYSNCNNPVQPVMYIHTSYMLMLIYLYIHVVYMYMCAITGGLFGPLEPSRDDGHSETSSLTGSSSTTAGTAAAAAPVSRAVAGAVGVCDAVDFVIPSADALPFTLAQRPGTEVRIA